MNRSGKTLKMVRASADSAIRPYVNTPIAATASADKARLTRCEIGAWDGSSDPRRYKDFPILKFSYR